MTDEGRHEIQKRREALHMSARDLSRLCGVSPKAITALEREGDWEEAPGSAPRDSTVFCVLAALDALEDVSIQVVACEAALGTLR